MFDYARLANRFRNGESLTTAELRRLHDYADWHDNYLLRDRVLAAARA